MINDIKIDNKYENKTNRQSKGIDKTEILRLHKIISPTTDDMNSIYTLYKKYVDPKSRTFNAKVVQTCGNSIVLYWRSLCNWYNLNKESFN
jgi:hypothetical protein